MTQASPLSVEPLLRATLRGEQPAWPWAGDPGAEQLVLARAAEHGVEGLLLARLPGGWPPLLRSALRDRVVARTAWELRHRQLLAQALAALADHGVQAVLLKGTALAYSLYADPVLRSRSDTDLLVRPRDRERLHDALLGCGFRPVPVVSGEYVSYQASYLLRDATGAHALDVHWRINNSEVLSLLFSYEELRAAARPLPALAPQAWAPGAPHALLIACMHLASHRTVPYHAGQAASPQAERLIWLADIDLLTRGLCDAEWDELIELGRRKGLLPVLQQSLALAAAAWKTAWPPRAGLALEDAPRGAASDYLAAGRTRQRWLDFMALPGAWARLRLVGETLFPPAAYMRARFGAAPLPWLYLRRLLRALARRLGPRAPG